MGSGNNFNYGRTISFLEKFTTCDISDSLVHAGIVNGGYIPNLEKRSCLESVPGPVVGKAYTVLYAPKDDPRPQVKASYIDEIPEDAILVIGTPLSCQLEQAPYSRINNALYGGLMSTRAQYRNARGSVILGRIRDVAEHNALGYPVWSYGVGSTAPGSVVKVVGINVPIEVLVTGIKGEEHICINPGDIISADENGVVRIPVSGHKGKESELDLDNVLEYIPKRVDADEKVSKAIKAGEPAAASQKFWRSKI